MESSNIAIKDVKIEVLNAIDTLRKRKTRPDFYNIANFLGKRCKFSEEQVKSYLEKMIKSEFVIKVDYKGNTSYRNAEKNEQASDNGQDVFISNDISSILEKLVSGAIAHNKQKYGLSENTGASLTSIELQSMKCSFETKLNRKTLKLALDREVSYGNRIRKLSNGNYIPVTILNDILSNDENQSQSSSNSESELIEISPQPVLQESKQSHLKRPFTFLKERDPGSLTEKREKQQVKTKKKVPFPNGRLPKWMIPHVYAKSLGSGGNNVSKKRGRPPSQRKRFKKYHGPDFLETSSLPSLDCIDPDPIVVEEEKKCDYCLMPASSNPSGIREELLICKDCNAKAHPSCMDYSSELARKSRLYPWQCMDCKICTVCEDAEDGECMLFCDSCDKGYHMSCHKPKIVEKPLGKWVCFQCGDEPQPKSSENLTTCRSKDQAKEEGVTTELSGLPTPCDSPASVESNDSDSKATLSVSNQIKDNSTGINGSSKLAYPETVPDAKDWTMEDVYKFLNEIGFPEQAIVFRDQEIDGKSLLLMKRSDVLTGMPNIRLGPALKIYNHIKRLQIGNPDGKIHVNPYSF